MAKQVNPYADEGRHGPFGSSSNYGRAKETQVELEKFLRSFPFTHQATLIDHAARGFCNGSNAHQVYARGRELLRQFHKQLDSKLLRLGRRFYQQPPEKRSFFVAVPEALNGYPHYHLLLRLPERRCDWGILTSFWITWIRLSKPSDLDFERKTVQVDRIRSDLDKHQLTKYVCKGLWNSEAMERVIFSSEFLPM